MEKTEAKAKPWQWPGEWARDEKFWRDVGSRTIAGILVVAFGYLAALAGGYISQPSAIPLVMVVGYLVLYIGVTAMLGNLYRAPLNADGTPRFDRTVRFWFWTVILVWLAGLLLGPILIISAFH